MTSRSASAAGQINGADFNDQAVTPSHVVAAGTTAVYSPDWNPQGTPPATDLAYALYDIWLPGYAGPQSLECSWSQPPTAGELWIGLGNLEQNSWDWHNGTCNIPAVAPYLDADHRMLAIIVLTSTAEAILERIEFRLAPTVVLTTTPDPAYGDPPLDVAFDGSGSSSPNGAIVLYEWDWDGDGIFDESTGVTPTAAHLYENPGQWEACLRVTDAVGAMRTGQVTVAVRGIFTTTVHTSEGFNGGAHDTTLLSIMGHPAISFYDRNSDTIFFVRAADPYGNTWNPAVNVVSDESVGFPSLAVVNGQPAIAFYFHSRLYYVRSSDFVGDTWGAPQLLHDEPGTGWAPSLQVVEGFPAIAYGDWGDSDIMYLRALDADGLAWGTPIVIDDDIYPSNSLAMTVLDDGPAIAFQARSTPDLLFITAADLTGSSWDPVMLLDGGADSLGWYISIDKFNFIPGVCYSNASTEELYFMMSQKPDGSSWNAPCYVGDVSIYGAHCSLSDIDGRPAISYCSPDRHLMYIRAATALGSLWTDPALLVDGDDGAGAFTSLNTIAEAPAMSYQCESELRYARIIE